MNRGGITISGAVLKELMVDIVPPDFAVSGVEYNFKTDCINIYGYSTRFEPTPEVSIPVLKKFDIEPSPYENEEDLP